MKKVSVLFVCHGNICRSTMAEFYMKHVVKENGLEAFIHIDSVATSRDEIGEDTYYKTKEKLDAVGIPYTPRKARQITQEEYDSYDYVIVMDDNNIRNLEKLLQRNIGAHVHKAMSFVGESRDVKDPWYTRDFDATYDDISISCDALLRDIEKKYF